MKNGCQNFENSDLFIYTFILKIKKKVLQSHNYIRLFTPLKQKKYIYIYIY